MTVDRHIGAPAVPNVCVRWLCSYMVSVVQLYGSCYYTVLSIPTQLQHLKHLWKSYPGEGGKFHQLTSNCQQVLN